MKIKEIRRHLPLKLRSLSNENLIALENKMELLAEIFIETFENGGSKKQLGVIDMSERSRNNGKRGE